MNVKGFNPRRTIIVSFLAISFLGNLSIAQTVGADGRRFNPGHYLAANRGDSATDITRALRSGVTGFQRRYYWAEIEPEQGKYDFSKIRADLDLAASQGMQLVVFIADKTFNRDIPLPNYLTGPQHMAKNRAGGYTALRWKPFVNSRFNALLTAVGQRFNSNNHFEGIAIQESSLSIDKQVLAANGYTPEKYRDAIKASLLTAAAAAPKSRVFWYMNFLTQNQSYLTEIALAVTGKGILMGGPDVRSISRQNAIIQFRAI